MTLITARLRALGVVLHFGFTLPAIACQICVPLPTRTLADWLIDSDAVTLAREDPDQAYQLAAVELLKGPDDVPPVELFLDSSTRRALVKLPDYHVICVWSRDGEFAGWRRVGATKDATAHQLVAEILELAPTWRARPEERFDYFAQKLGQPHPLVGPLAYLEIGKASYQRIRGLRGQVEPAKIRAFLGDIQMMEWHALYILLLAGTGDPEDQEMIRVRIDSIARTSIGFQLAAWATALIEIDGSAGVTRLRELYTRRNKRTADEINAVRSALQVHADGGRIDAMDAIVAAYGDLLETHAVLAPELADDLTRWQRFDHAATFARWLDEAEQERVLEARIRYHLHQAATAPDPRP